MSRVGDRLIAAGTAWNDPGRRLLLVRRVRKLHRTAFAALMVGLLVLFALIDRVGERNVATAFLLYLPAQIWLIPVLFFAGTALLLLDWRLLAGVLAVAAGIVWFYLDWEPGAGRRGGGGRELTVMTFNRGQRSGSLQPFKERHRPDLIAMQEAASSSAAYLKAEGYEDLPHGRDIGEFLLLSRFPIRDAGLVEIGAGGRVHPVAAWFVVDFEGVEIVVYNVHLPTPRDQLLALRRGGFLRGFWPGSSQARSYQSFWDLQMLLARGIEDRVRSEKRPVLVVGDFNAPDRGRVYAGFSRFLQDSHEEAGSGFGWTFPGVTRNPLSGFGPWLRIDHQFAGADWKVLESTAETGRKSQHLAVAARYELVATASGD